MLSQSLHGSIEGLDRSIGARKHNAAFHDGEHIRCQRFFISILWQSCRIQTLANSANPPMEVFRDELVCWTILRIDLQSQPPQRAAILRVGHQDALAVAGENGENAFDRLGSRSVRGLDDHRAKRHQVPLQHFPQQRFLAVEEMIEAA